MARKPQSRTDDGTVERTVTRTVESMDEGPEEGSLQEMEAYENVERIRSELGDSEGYVLLARRLANGQLATLAKINASIFDVDYIIKKYGGGVYSARFFKSGVAIHAGGFLGSVPFNIDPSVQPEPEPAPVARGSSGGDAPTWLAAVLDKMGDAIKTMADRKPEPPPPPPTPIDPMAMIRAIGETMKALTPAPAPAPAPAPGLKDQIDMIKSVVEVGTTILDARSEGGGGGGSGDDYMNTVAKLAEPITDLVKLRVQQETDHRRLNPAGRQPRLTLSRNAVTGPAPVAATGGQPVIGVPAWLVEVQKWIPMIVKRARGGKSAEDTAFFILDELSEPTVQALAAQAAQPDFGVKLAQVLPVEMQKYPEWVTEFMAAMHDWLFGGDEGTTSDEDEPQTDGPVGLGGDDDEPVEVEGAAFDLDAEAQRRMAVLRDKPEDAKTPEPVPVG